MSTTSAEVKSHDHELCVRGVTANCGNSTIGERSTDKLVSIMAAPGGPDILVIHCQEVHWAKERKQLQLALNNHPKLGLVASDLMVTRTKFEKEVIARHTGIATFVLYNTDRVKEAHFAPKEQQMVRGKNKNKGGLLNTLVVTKRDDPHPHRIRTISGHLDSNSAKKRCGDWQNLKRKNAFEAGSWDELVRSVPDLQIAGYDANTRNLWDSKTGTHVNLWESDTVHAGIASLALAPIGTELYSSPNTYNTHLPEMTEDKKRRGYAKGGSLDFVALQNNTTPPSPLTPASSPTGYSPAPESIGPERGTERDHNVTTSDSTVLQLIIPFERVRNYIAAELRNAAPQLAGEVSALVDTPVNQKALLALHRYYLSPEGALIKRITPESECSKTDVKPWFEGQTLQQFLVQELERGVCAINKRFDPKRRIFANKTQYIAPLEHCNMAYQAYRAAIEAKVPASTEDLDKALVELEGVTNDPKKKTSIKNFRQSLELVQTHPLFLPHSSKASQDLSVPSLTPHLVPAASTPSASESSDTFESEASNSEACLDSQRAGVSSLRQQLAGLRRSSDDELDNEVRLE